MTYIIKLLDQKQNLNYFNFQNNTKKATDCSSNRQYHQTKSYIVIQYTTVTIYSRYKDVLETVHRNKSPLKLSLFQRQVSSFLQRFCPQLNSDDVLCNEIFFEGFQVSAAKISEYQSLLKLYLGDVSRKRKSDLTSKITDINKQLDMLKNKMLKASDIKLDLKKGTMHLSILAAQKSSFLCEIVATASKIRDKTQNCKLKERLAEQSQCKNKDLCKVMEPELKLKCLNIDLLWVKGYHNLEIRNLKRIPANTKFT